MIVIAMDKLYKELYMLYSNELMNLNIGYSYNQSNLNKMMDIVSSINYMQQCPFTEDDLKYIKVYYG
jgi:hypothetical protein